MSYELMDRRIAGLERENAALRARLKTDVEEAKQDTIRAVRDALLERLHDTEVAGWDDDCVNCQESILSWFGKGGRFEVKE